MWIVLIDCSGSMGEGFEGGLAFEGRTVASTRTVKLDAAREAILERLAGLNPSERVALVAFNTKAWLAFNGTAADARDSRGLADLVPEHGTDLAAAFDFTLQYLQSSPGLARVLLVSDCKTEVTKASSSADRLAAERVLIDVLLIDPSESTLSVARAVVRFGEVQAVAGAEDLKNKLVEADQDASALMAFVGAQQTAARERAQQALARAHEEAQSSLEHIAGGSAPPEEHALQDIDTPPCFSVSHQSAILPGISNSVYVVIHRPEHSERIAVQLRDALGGRNDADLVVEPARCRVPLGSTLEVELIAPELDVNPGSFQPLRWEGVPARCRFVVRGRAELAPGRRIDARVRVYFGDADLVDIPISFTVGPNAAAPQWVVAKPPESIFLSYSRNDQTIVDRCRGYWEKLGVCVYQDTQNLPNKVGHAWRKELEALVVAADAFKLFWSDSSAASKPVEDEWRYALSLMPPKGIKPSEFIRPLRWSEFAPRLPAELAHLQMSMLEPERAHDPRNTSKPVGIVPLLEDVDPHTLEALMEDVRVAATFVQERTGLTCDPPPVLLVDEHVTTRIVESNPVREGLDQLQGHELWTAVKVVQAFALDLHVGFRGCLDAASVDQGQLTLEALLPDLGPEASRHARELAEWIIQSLGDVVFKAPGWRWDNKTAPQLIAAGATSTAAERNKSDSDRLQECFVRLSKFGASRNMGDVEPKDALRQLIQAYRLAFSQVMHRAGGKTDYVSQYSVPEAAADAAFERWGRADLRADVSRWDSKQVHFSGSMDAIVRLFSNATESFLLLIERALASSSTKSVSVVQARNYAVYTQGDKTTDAILRDWAIENNVAARFTLPGARRIVLALNPLNEATQALSDITARRLLRRGVLIHELWHAALNAARLTIGLTVSADVEPYAEEGVAVWLEADHARTNPETHAAVLEFVDHGVLPDWPYAAMHVIERDYEAKGLSGVRATVELLRSDPKSANARILR